jgi:Domain of unknown function (DUF5667)
MSSLHPARRSAERFNSLLHGEQETARDARDADLLEVVGALQTLPRVEARPEFVADLRERLLLAAETDLVAGDASETVDERLTVRTRRTPRERRLAIALGGFAIVGATTSMAVAAQSALPGDVLYPLKRAIENAESGIRVSDEAKGNTILANASGRLDEVDRLTREDEVDADAVSETLGAFAEQAEEASDLLLADYAATGSEDSINELRDFTAASILVLADLEEIIPAGAEQALLDAAQVLFEIDSAAANLCPLCDSPGITEIPVPLLASGDTKLDDAAVEAGENGPATATNPDKGDKPGNGGKGPVISATEPPTDPIQLPTQSAGGGAGGGNGGPNNPVGSGGVTVSVSVPPIGVPEVDTAVSQVIEGVDEVLGGLTGPSNP